MPLCSNSCKTCETSESQCTSCDSGLGLILDKSKCVSCFEKFYGCDNKCLSMSCDSCLEFFKTSTIGQCESTKKPEHPKYKIVGFARYHRIGKRIIFRMYLRVIFSMMYGSKLEFTLTATEKTTLF